MTAPWLGLAAIAVLLIALVALAFRQEHVEERSTPRPDAPSRAHPGVRAAQNRARLAQGRPVDGDALDAAESRALAEVEWDSTWIRVPESRYEAAGCDG